MAKKVKLSKQMVWCIAYIDAKTIDKVNQDLREFKGVEAYIPTVKILKKTFKQKNEFEHIPLLFNYGFFKIPRRNAINPEYLAELKEKVSCIYSWVKDPTVVYVTKPIWRPDEDYQPTAKQVPVALATEEEIANIIKSQDETTIYSAKDLQNRKEGDIITLQGYPFEDMEAQILYISHNKQEVKVKILVESLMKEVTVSFDNVFYTIYKGGFEDDYGKEKSLEEIGARGKVTMDKLMANISGDEAE